MTQLKSAFGATVLLAALAASSPAAPNASDDREKPAAPPMLQTTTRKLSPTVEARREVADARSVAGRYRLAVNKKRQKLEHALAVRADYREAVIARNKAKAAFEQASRPALLAVRGGDEHRRTKAQWVSANAMAGAAISGGAGALVEIRSIREDLGKCAASLKEMEDKAVAADPQAAEARAALEQAEEKLAALHDEHVTLALESDPAYTSAKTQLQAAEARLETAQAQLAKVSQDSKDAKEAARYAYLAEQEALRKARMAAPS
jgi:chromosome segregation ATPase